MTRAAIILAFSLLLAAPAAAQTYSVCLEWSDPNNTQGTVEYEVGIRFVLQSDIGSNTAFDFPVMIRTSATHYLWALPSTVVDGDRVAWSVRACWPGESTCSDWPPEERVDFAVSAVSTDPGPCIPPPPPPATLAPPTNLSTTFIQD